jgi:hypothetical protein
MVNKTTEAITIIIIMMKEEDSSSSPALLTHADEMWCLDMRGISLSM